MKGMIIGALLLISFVSPARAQFDVPGVDEVWTQAQMYGVTPEESLEDGMPHLLGQIPVVLENILTAGIRTGIKLFAVVLVCALGQGMEQVGKEQSFSVIRLSGALAITALTMTDIASMIGLGRDTIARMDGFSTVLLPVMTALSAMSGAISTAAIRQGATVLFSKGLMAAMDTILVPVVYAYVVVSCAQAVLGSQGLERLAQGIKSAVTTFLTVLLVVFVGYLTASGAITGSVDMARVKAAKLAISRAIPVVGGILADASETVLAGAGVMRGSVGAVGMLTVLAICLTPFLHLGAQYVIYKGTAALCTGVAQQPLAKLIDAIGSAFGLILGMTGAAALILLVSVVSAVLAVTG